MLALAEYLTNAIEIEQLGKQKEADIKSRLLDKPTRIHTLEVARKVADEYRAEVRPRLRTSWTEIAETAVDHYAGKLGVDPPEGLAKSIVDRQYLEKYYGATLHQRLWYNDRTLARRVTQSVNLDPQHATRIWSESFPYGAHNYTQRVLLLGTAAKIENDVAKEMAQHAGIPLLRWTLSHRHKGEDDCDRLANRVDKSVVNYLKSRDSNMDPKGLYFAKELPQPPHPNCQCEYGMTKPQRKIASGPVKRSFNRVLKILRRWRPGNQ